MAAMFKAQLMGFGAYYSYAALRSLHHTMQVTVPGTDYVHLLETMSASNEHAIDILENLGLATQQDFWLQVGPNWNRAELAYWVCFCFQDHLLKRDDAKEIFAPFK